MKWENNRHIHIQLSYLESDQNRMAKRQYIRRWTGKWALGCLLAVSALWTVSGLLAGCSEESVETSEEFRLVLKLPPALTVDTRGTINQIPVNRIWVLQYVTEDGKSTLKNKAFFTVPDDQAGKNPPPTIEITTGKTTFTQTKSRFYVIANAEESFWKDFTGTEVELKAKTVAFSGYTNQPSLLTSGPLEYTPDPTKPGVIPLVVPLRRAYATISLSWNKKGDLAAKDNPSSLVVKSVSLYNVPANMALYTRGGGSIKDKYPADKDGSTAITSIDGTQITTDLSPSSPCKFYMPENLRGMGTAASFMEKSIPAKGPDGKLDYCTYIKLSGEYKYAGASAPIGVNYLLHLGGNLMTDYNIRRDYLYNLTVNISGANSADVRVTITDGNVVMFDAVEVLPVNNVVFK
ncbi:DUF4906 domain-containing protein [Bacteroides fragilis]